MILDKIAAATQIRVDKAKKELPLDELRAQLYKNGELRSFNNRREFAFERTLSKAGINFICEVKKASPSKGVIAEDFPYLQIAMEYEEAGTDAISVLTEPDFFLGSNKYLSEISRLVNVPVLRKDFTIDEYQIYEAKLIGADAVLLICSLLGEETIRHFISICDELGLSALVEAHSEEEVAMAVSAGARLIGVNNRNLKTFEVDINNSIKLRNLVPKNIIFVAESGIRSSEDVSVLRNAGVNSVLIGETLMRSSNKKEQLSHLRDNRRGASYECNQGKNMRTAESL